MVKTKLNLENNAINIALYLLTFVVNILLYFLIFSKISQNGILYYFNSDTLYFPTLFKDLFIDGYSLKGWYVPGAPNLLPDMMLYFLIMAFFRNPIYASFVYGIVQFIILLLLINWLINIISQKKNYILNSIVNLIMSFFFFVYIFSNDFLFTFHIISNTYHLGAFLFTLLSLILVINYLQTNKRIFANLLLIIASLAVFNDKLFIIMFSIPLFSLIIFFNKKNAPQILRLLIYNFISIIIGVVLFRILELSKILNFSGIDNLINFSRAKFSLNLFFDLLNRYLKANTFHSIIIYISSTTFLISVVYLVKNFKKNIFKSEIQTNENNSIFFFYTIFFIVSSILIMFVPLIIGTYLDNSCIRYNIFTFYILTFNFFPIIFIFLRKIQDLKSFKLVISAIILVTTIIYSIIFGSKFSIKKFKEYTNYYPKCAECIDNYIEKNGNIYGTATYWIGKVALNFSKKGARIYTVYDDSMYPLPHVGNINWYRDNKGKYNKPVYSFIVVDNNQDLGVLVKNYGNPIKVDTCDKYFIFKYKPFKFTNTNEPYFINSDSISKQKYIADFENEIFRLNNSHIISDDVAFSGKYSNYLNNENEYSYTHSVRYDEIKNKNFQTAQVICKIYCKTKTEFNLVLSINLGEKNIYWKNLKVEKNETNTETWQEFNLIANLPKDLNDLSIIKAYVWNNKKSEIYVDDIQLNFF